MLHDFGRFSTGHEAPLWGFTTKKVLVGSMCQGDRDGRLNGDAAQRQHSTRGVLPAKTLVDGTGVQLRYYVTLPASLVSSIRRTGVQGSAWSITLSQQTPPLCQSIEWRTVAKNLPTSPGSGPDLNDT